MKIGFEAGSRVDSEFRDIELGNIRPEIRYLVTDLLWQKESILER